ncbi:glycosyltransferase [Microbacterium sp. ARD32]|uniref:glycosyltransferase n=1 Tax=Microbacterium sp. ARD32 TaxID=2962577 RepID=UPI0028810B49|nr:glycosyltransferase [Microbacterium sp. ARD32]MDT0156410.1 glycosyltransferase [Microbacterium sp. ARD32]
MTGLTRVLFLSHSHAFGSFRVGSHHYARELARRGAEVVHLSTPISRVHRWLRRVSGEDDRAVPRGTHRDADGVTHLVPRTVLPAPYGRFEVARELADHGIGLDFDAVLIDQPLLWDESVRQLSKRLVYRPTDLYPSGVKHRIQPRIVAAADGVVATSSEVLRGLGGIRRPSLVIGNGVDVGHFTAAQDDSDPRPPVCVYVGALDARFDWDQLIRWARARADVHFVVAGPSPQPPVALPSNVELVGAVSYDDLPSLLHSARVGLLPLSDDPLNAGRSPMKLYEYLAAGLAVLARETPVIRADESTGIHTYSDADDGSESLEQALAHASPNRDGETRAMAESWAAKTDQLVDFILDLPRR